MNIGTVGAEFDFLLHACFEKRFWLDFVVGFLCVCLCDSFERRGGCELLSTACGRCCGWVIFVNGGEIALSYF